MTAQPPSRSAFRQGSAALRRAGRLCYRRRSVLRSGPPNARSRRGRLAAVVACVAALAGGLVVLPAAAQQGGFGASRAQLNVERGKTFLQRVQNADGGLPKVRGGDSDPAVSAWAALALASAKVSPRDQTRKGGTSLWTYLNESAGELGSTDDLARLALVARAAKSSPEKVGEVTPIATITSRQAADGGIADARTGKAGVVPTAWAVLALPAGETRTKARRWLVEARNAGDGGWPATKGGASDSVATGLALQALRTTVPATPSYRFLRDAQRSGGLARLKGGAPESLATALVIQGGVAAASEADRQQLSLGTDDPTSYLWKRQGENGGVGSILQTAQVLPALAGRPYPLRAISSSGPTNTGDPVADEGDDEDGTTTTTTSTTPSRTGTSTAPNAVAGGQGDDDSTGTTATGGGSGAPGDVAGAGAPATTTQAAPPATTTTGAAPATTPATPSDQVTGSVVGSTEAAPAAATTGGGGGDDEDRSGLVLAGLIVLFVAFGAWLERRPTRLRGVAS